MSLELHVLGTSSARPAQGRSVSGSLLETLEGIVVIDCGEGFQNRLVEHRKAMKEHAGRRIKVSRLSAILLTHGHLDHTWGVLPWLQTLALDGRKDELFVIGPTSPEVIDTLINGEGEAEVDPSDLVIQYDMWIDLGATTEALGYELSFVLGDGERWYQLGKGLLEELPQPLKGAEISAHTTAHTIPSFAWKISNSDRLGKFNREKAAGLPLEMRTKLANGEDVQHDGETLLAKEFRDEPRLGHSIIVSGDTAERSIDTDCDLLIHEATFLETHAALADDHLHSTAAGAARTAVACEAKHLALTHYSGRLEDHTLSLDEARSIHASVVACGDGDRLRLEEDGSLAHLVKTENGWLTS